MTVPSAPRIRAAAESKTAGYFDTPQADRVQTETCIKCRKAPAAAGSVVCDPCHAISAAMGCPPEYRTGDYV